MKPGNKVFVLSIPDVRLDTLIHIIHRKIKPVRVVYTNTFRNYNILDVSEFKQNKINQSKLSTNEKNILNAIVKAGRRKLNIVWLCSALCPDVADPGVAFPSDRLDSN